VEVQSLRTVRRYLDYGSRVKSGQGMEELYQWIGRILLDEGQVYSLEDRALAFEIGACERLADCWPDLQRAGSGLVVVGGGVDRVLAYRQLLCRDCSSQRGAAFLQLLASRYDKHWEWIAERASARGNGASTTYLQSGYVRLFEGFLRELDLLDPLPEESAREETRLRAELDRLQEEGRRRDVEFTELKKDLEFAEDRSGRAFQRIKKLDEELNQLRKDLRDARENSEKLRDERRNRIKSERQSDLTRRELERLQREYLKLEQRLQEMARRLILAEQRRLTSQQQNGAGFDLNALRRLEPVQLLGGEKLSEEEVGRIRRRFAAVFHPDRVNQLPAWAKGLCDEILGVVNEACDRALK
jgi:hypothetical protein